MVTETDYSAAGKLAYAVWLTKRLGLKGNPYHDEDGRFTTADGAATGAGPDKNGPSARGLISMSANSRHAKVVNAAHAMIDAVHHGGDEEAMKFAPTVEVSDLPIKEEIDLRGVYEPDVGGYRIRLRTGYETDEARTSTYIHEFGHHMGMGILPEEVTDDIVSVIQNTTMGYVELKIRSEKPGREGAYNRYRTQPTELFAEAYRHWVYYRNGQKPPGRIWPEDDFEDVMDALDAAFKQHGMR